MRARLINRFEKYGNDIDDVDNISAELLRHYCKEVEKYRNPRGGIFTRLVYRLRPCAAWRGRGGYARWPAGEQLADGGLSPMLGGICRGRRLC